MNIFLRVGGRLSKASMPEETKHPLILVKDQHISILILCHIHEQLGHGGRNHVLSHLRKRYWITGPNAEVRKVITRCYLCRRYRGKVREQKMADLPIERIIPDMPPLTNVGVDYFGPKRSQHTKASWCAFHLHGIQSGASRSCLFTGHGFIH